MILYLCVYSLVFPSGELDRKHERRESLLHCLSLVGAAEACGGATGKQQLHDPPLIFDLERDTSEETPLDVRTPEYKAIAERIARRREELLWDIATDESVSTADYSVDKSAAPCCDQTQAVCRCHTQG